ncbi:TraQ conjugal transfer family protein [Duncaniella muris]|uniref:TraQ conjugal transfer family protein n=3 Tax=Duncaniella muris TaxID=2094150 RepID=UPI0020CEAD7B|nr:TraQ conjugal transfer family protein [Duncaniella muris]
MTPSARTFSGVNSKYFQGSIQPWSKGSSEPGFSNTIRYFQYDGEGTLKLVDGPVLVNNDRVLLESKTFRLNYTAQSSEAVKFGIWIEDNFGSTPWQQTFEFNSKDSGDDGGKTPGIITPVNPGTITPIGL